MVQFRDFRQSVESMVDAIIVFVTKKPMNRKTERDFSFQREKILVVVQIDKSECGIA